MAELAWAEIFSATCNSGMPELRQVAKLRAYQAQDTFAQRMIRPVSSASGMNSGGGSCRCADDSSEPVLQRQ